MHDPQVRLTEEERRRLDELEAALREEDPRLAHQLQNARRVPVLGLVAPGELMRRGRVGGALATIGAIMTIALFVYSLWLAVVGLLLLALGSYLLLTAPGLERGLRRLEAWLTKDRENAR